MPRGNPGSDPDACEHGIFWDYACGACGRDPEEDARLDRLEERLDRLEQSGTCEDYYEEALDLLRAVARKDHWAASNLGSTWQEIQDFLDRVDKADKQ